MPNIAGAMPKLHFKFNWCQQTLSLHFTLCIWLVLLCCVMSQVQERHEIGYRFDTIKDYNFHKQSNIVVSCYTTSYHDIWCIKSFPVSSHHSFLPKDCAPGTQSTRWVAVTLDLRNLMTDLDPTLGSQYSQCLTVLVWTNPRLTPQGLDSCSYQAPCSDPEPV